jgi:hypothetical protein
MQLTEHFKDRWPFRTVIWDESDKLAGYRLRQGAQRAAAIADYAFEPHTVRWYNLSGTPAANSYLDLWGPQYFIDGGATLGRSFAEYERRWFAKPPHGDRYTKLMLLPGAQEAIQERLRPSTIALRAADWLPVKTPIEVTLSFDLPPYARDAYNRMRRQLLVQLEAGDIVALNAGVKAGKLRQIASGVSYASLHQADDCGAVVLHTVRLERLKALVAELRGAPLLVVYQWKHEARAIQQAFPQAKDVREPDSIKAWSAKQLPMLLVHPDSGGHGLNLQHGGHHICFYTPLSDNRRYAQVVERLGPTRQLQSGYDRMVHIYHLEALQSIDQHTRDVREGRESDLSALLKALRA